MGMCCFIISEREGEIFDSGRTGFRSWFLLVDLLVLGGEGSFEWSFDEEGSTNFWSASLGLLIVVFLFSPSATCIILCVLGLEEGRHTALDIWTNWS